MEKTNLFEYMAYLEQKVEQKRAEQQKESFEKFERAQKEREKERQAFADLFAKAIKGQNNGKQCAECLVR